VKTAAMSGCRKTWSLCARAGAERLPSRGSRFAGEGASKTEMHMPDLMQSDWKRFGKQTTRAPIGWPTAALTAGAGIWGGKTMKRASITALLFCALMARAQARISPHPLEAHRRGKRNRSGRLSISPCSCCNIAMRSLARAGVHAKDHGCVKGTLAVDADIPEVAARRRGSPRRQEL